MRYRVALWFLLSAASVLFWAGCSGEREINDDQTSEPQQSAKVEIKSSPTRTTIPETREPVPTPFPTLTPAPIEFPPAGAVVTNEASPAPTPRLIPTKVPTIATRTTLQPTGRDPNQRGPANPCDVVSDDSKDDCRKNPCNYVPDFAKQACEKATQNDPNFGVADPNLRKPKTKAEQGYVENYDPNYIPKIAKYNFTELYKCSKMSKLRSAVGHDYSGGSIEYDPSRSNCKSIKHYLVQKGVPNESALYATTPHTFTWKSIKFFSPVDGTIQDVSYSQNESGTEARFAIGSSEHIGYYFVFFHIDLNPELKNGSTVQAGQQIGTLGSEDNWGEIAVQVRISDKDTRLISFLEIVTDDVLQEYRDRGVAAPSDVIISKEQRDAKPLACDNSEAGWFIGSGREGTPMDMDFITWQFESADNWFFFE